MFLGPPLAWTASTLCLPALCLWEAVPSPVGPDEETGLGSLRWEWWLGVSSLLEGHSVLYETLCQKPYFLPGGCLQGALHPYTQRPRGSDNRGYYQPQGIVLCLMGSPHLCK